MEMETLSNIPQNKYHINSREKDDGEESGRTKYSLLRACSLHDQDTFILPALSCRRRSVEQTGGVVSGPMSTNVSREAIFNDMEIDQEEMKTDHDSSEGQIDPFRSRRATISSGATAALFNKKRPSNFRDWPLGEVKIKNQEGYFELQLHIGPFTPEEVSARIVGKDLIIHCKPNLDWRDVPLQEIFRCYTLPLNMVPAASQVSVTKDEQWIRIGVRKDPPLSPIGLFAPEIAEILEEEQQQGDTEEEMEVRMED